jgi:translation initiation factor 4E
MDHYLEYPWTLYVTKQRTVQGHEKSIQEWEDRLEKIHIIKTAESFWSVHSHLRSPSEMKNERGDFYLFKDEILPEWEHPSNHGGGSLTLNIDQFKVDEVWLRLQLEVIGNTIDKLDIVCGLELAIRKIRYKIAVWVNNSSSSLIKELSQDLVKLPHVVSVEFRRHGKNDHPEFTIK